MTREEWLWKMTKALERLVFKPADIEVDLNKLKVSVGFPSKGGTRAKNKTIGQCWSRNASAGKVNEIFINPCLDKKDVTRVAGVLVHEMIHAVDNCEHGHRGPFRKMALACGLAGKMTATIETPELQATIKKIVKTIGPYPHHKLDHTDLKKQGVRNLKIECPKCVDSDPYFVRMSRTMYEKGAPKCGVCETTMTDDIIGATIKDIKKASANTIFTGKEQILLFEVARQSEEHCGQWMTNLQYDNYSWFIGEEMMDRLNWSKEKVGGVMASLKEKKAIEFHDGVGEMGSPYAKNVPALCIPNNDDLYDLFEQWMKEYPEHCDNPFTTAKGDDK